MGNVQTDKVVIKRDGRRKEYDSEKIMVAIYKAMKETGIENAEAKADNITIAVDNRIYKRFFKKEKRPTVEDIQDTIEEVLMENNYFSTAKSYILYRKKREESRGNRPEKGLLSKDFLSPYKKKPNPFPTQLGEFIFYRTYSRWLDNEIRREYWWETVKRAVNYNTSLTRTTREEAENLFDDVYNFRVFLAGRTLFTGNTKASKKYPMSNFNCSFVVIDSFDAFLDLFYNLMVGAGAGFRVMFEDVEKLPKVKNDVELTHKQYEPVAKSERLEHTEFKFDTEGKVATLVIGDSKGGWMQGLEYLFKFVTEHEYRPLERIIINYDNVRPKGERLKTFGGTASGFQSLKRMFDKIDNVFKRDKGTDRHNRVKLETIDAMDIANIIAENVVVGGVRRSSEICLFHPEDDKIRKAKSNLYVQEDGEWEIDKSIAHRQMSNNSILYHERPSREKLHEHIQELRISGEPGFINAKEAKRRREDFEGVNPCFTGDMKLLTDEGYKRFDILAEEDGVNVVNKEGNVTSGNVWSNGEKEIVEVSFYNRDSIKCTPDHVFMTNEGEEVQAKNLIGKVIMPYFDSDIKKDELLVKDVQLAGREEVFDFSEPETHWGVVEGKIAHNCGEALLPNKGMCNLVSVNAMAFVEDGHLAIEDFIESHKRATRAAYRMALIEFELHDWDLVNKRDRLIGVSLTGWQDMVNATGIDRETERKVLRTLRLESNKTAKKYAEEKGDKEPVLVTIVKPEGCITKDHVRVTDEGILFIDEIDEDIENNTVGEFKEIDGPERDGNKISKSYLNNKQDIIKLTLANGRELKLSKSHPLSVGGEWVEASDLEVGDKLDYKLGSYKNEEHSKLKSISINEFRETSNGMIDYKLPKEMDGDLAWLIGAYLANGSFPDDKRKHQHRIKFHSGNYEVHKKVQRIWEEQFGVKTEIIKQNDRESYVQDFSSVKIRKWFEKNGFAKENSQSFNRSPLLIRKSSYKDIINFIIGYADNDGSFHNGSMSIDSANKNIIRHFQELGESVGISFGYSENTAREKSFSKKPMYKAILSRSETLKSVIEYINEISVKAKERPVENSDQNYSSPYRVEKKEIINDKVTYGIQVDNEHWYYQGGLKSHNTQTQMPTVSSGLHFNHSPYYLRRVRISADDPLVLACEEQGFNTYPEVGQDEETCDTKVIEFPVKAPKGRVKGDVSALEQLEVYKMFMQEYVDHNASITVHVRDDEWEDVEEWLYENWDSVVGISFISYDDSFYDLMPYQEISKEEYEEYVEETPEFNPSIVNKYEARMNVDKEREIEEDGCESGACPIR